MPESKTELYFTYKPKYFYMILVSLYFPGMILCKLGKDSIFIAVWAFDLFLPQKLLLPVAKLSVRGTWSPAYVPRHIHTCPLPSDAAQRSRPPTASLISSHLAVATSLRVEIQIDLL